MQAHKHNADHIHLRVNLKIVKTRATQDFRLILLGESFPESPPIFAEAESRLRALGRVGHWGFADSRAK